MKLRHACVLLIVCCAGCATLSPTPPGCVKIGPVGRACPLPPATLPAVQASHIVTVTHAAEKHTFLGRLAIDHQALRLAGASLFGTHLFTITWDGHSVTSQPPEPKMHPDLVVVMLEIALVDPARMRPHLHGMVLKVSRDGNKDVRELYEHGHLVARIERRGTPLAAAHMLIHVPQADLTLRLSPLHASPSPAGTTHAAPEQQRTGEH
jgi:hypothetical protein